MCGRAACTLDPAAYRSKITKAYHSVDVDEWRGEDKSGGATYNLSPAQRMAVAYMAPGGGFALKTMRWGFPNPMTGGLTINAVSETLHERPMFGKLLNSHRCVIYLSGFFEWQKTSTNRVPYFIHSSNGGQPYKEDSTRLLPVAGLWQRRQDLKTKEEQDYFVIVTIAATQAFAAIHDRMPCVLSTKEEVTSWMDLSIPFPEARKLLQSSGDIEWYKVDPKMSTTNSRRCVDPYTKTQPTLFTFGVKKAKTEAGPVKTEVKEEPFDTDARRKVPAGKVVKPEPLVPKLETAGGCAVGKAEAVKVEVRPKAEVKPEPASPEVFVVSDSD